LSRLSVPKVVLGLLCALYLIMYVDRVNIATAAPLIKSELSLSNTKLGIIFSAFAIPYALFQLIGGWVATGWERGSRWLFVAPWSRWRLRSPALSEDLRRSSRRALA
jgi:MFS family permease